MNDFVQRNVEGTQALWRAMTDSSRLPGRLAYLAVGESAMWASLFAWPRSHARLRGLADAATLPLLGFLTADPWARAGLAAGAVAKVEKARAKTPTLVGTAAVAASHVAFASRLWRAGARNDGLGWSLRVAAGAASVHSRNPQVIAATAAVAATSALAGDSALRADATKGISHGANLIFVSEALTYARVLRESRILAAAEVATSVLGHLLLVDGINRLP